MKRFWYIILAVALLAMSSCDRRKIIPDEELAAIFHDAVVVNAYIGQKHIRLDSINIYEPIFERYGYTTDDVRYTIASFLRRKSANLSDVVDEMIKSIEDEYDILREEVAKLDTIESVATRRSHRKIMEDSAIVIKTKRDTSKLRYNIDFAGAGDYQVTVAYSIDKNDKSRGRRMTVKKMMQDSSKHQISSVAMNYRENSFSSCNFTISEHEADDIIGFELYFDDFSQASKTMQKKHPRPKITKMEIKHLMMQYTPTLEQGIEDLYHEQLGIQIFADTLIHSIEQLKEHEDSTAHSSTLSD